MDATGAGGGKASVGIPPVDEASDEIEAAILEKENAQVEEDVFDDDDGEDGEDDYDDGGGATGGGGSGTSAGGGGGEGSATSLGGGRRRRGEGSKRAKARQLAREQRELHEKRLAKLEELKKQQLERKAAVDAGTAEKRLEYLMQQAEVFTHFVHGEGSNAGGGGGGGGSSSSSAGGADGGGAGGRGSRRGRGGGKSGGGGDDEDGLAEEADHAQPGVKITKQPSIVMGALRDYQLEGLNWMVNLHDNNISGILADEMGLGKTLQSISLLAFLKEYRGITGPHLVLSPKSTLGNWKREFTRWCPSFKVLKLSADTKEERTKLVREDLMSGEYDVIITSFETLCIERAAFRKFALYYVIIDEAHRIKNEKSLLAQEVRKLDSQYRLLLTGTPLQNNLHELWALLNFLLPDVFSSSDDFDAWFATGGQVEVIKKLHAVIRPFLLRRLKIDVERSLLPKIETKLYIGMSELQRKWYKGVLYKDATALNEMGGPDRVRLLNILMQLRKVCNHPYLFEGAEPGPPFIDGPHIWESCGKMVLLAKLLPKLKAQGSRVLIFSQMTRVLDILEDFCRLTNYEYCRIDGNTGSVERETAMEEYNAPNSSKFVFLLATRAGGLGINLYTADIVILYDSDWNPQADLQAMDRAHRIGQKKQVRVFRLITDHSVEEKIVERAERKLFLDAVVIQQGRLAQQDKALSKGELMNMVKFGADEIFRGDGSLITDEDVDAILAKSEERSKAASELLKQSMAQTLGNMNIEDLLKSDTSKFLYEGDGGSNSGAGGGGSGGGGGGGLVVPLGEREKRRVVYDERAYYQSLDGGAARGRPPGPKLVKPPTMVEYQFFSRKRIEELVSHENELLVRRKEVERLIKEIKPRENKEEKRFIMSRVRDLMYPRQEGAIHLSEAEATDKANAEYQAKRDRGEIESVRLERELETLALTADEQAEKDKLLSEGFVGWSRRDFRLFLAACERYGRTQKEALFAEVAEVTEKDVEEVARYYDVFWARYTELQEARKIEERVDKGETRIKRRDALETVISDKVGRIPDPFRTLHVPYGPGKPVGANRGFTEEEDRFLICMLHQVGYGAWDKMQMEIRKAEQFRFDFFIKSRTTADIARRCDNLIRMLEKEAIDAGTVAGRELAIAGLGRGGRPRGKLAILGGSGAVGAGGGGAGGGDAESASSSVAAAGAARGGKRRRKGGEALFPSSTTTTSSASAARGGGDDE